MNTEKLKSLIFKGLLVIVHACMHVKNQNVLAVEPQVFGHDELRLLKCHQACNDQHHGQCELKNNQALPQGSARQTGLQLTLENLRRSERRKEKGRVATGNHT